MKNSLLIATIFLLGLFIWIGCLGTSRADLIGISVAKTLTAMPSQMAAATPIPTSSPKIALLSYHGRYVTALGEDGDWLIKQETELGTCGWFTQRRLDNGKVALLSCYGRYVTVSRRGTTRQDWQLWQDSGLGDCAQFDLFALENDKVAFKACTGKFFTAGDGMWASGLQWSVVAEMDKIDSWERFTLLH
jgi:hypothetical protein